MNKFQNSRVKNQTTKIEKSYCNEDDLSYMKKTDHFENMGSRAQHSSKLPGVSFFFLHRPDLELRSNNLKTLVGTDFNKSPLSLFRRPGKV
jgi:hypothetical protein